MGGESALIVHCVLAEAGRQGRHSRPLGPQPRSSGEPLLELPARTPQYPRAAQC